MKSIHVFKKGDVITRITPAKPYFFGGDGDRSYMGDKCEFVGIANGQLYVTIKEGIWESLGLNNKPQGLALDLWSDGWDYWVDPDTLLNLSDGEEFKMSNEQIQSKIDEALEMEDYETAEKLKQKLK